MNIEFLDFVRLIARGDLAEVPRLLASNPAFATTSSTVGATRQNPAAFFFSEISHYLYAGDTALHIAAAAFNRPIADLLVSHGADCRATNRRGDQPLHYAADTNRWDPEAQTEIINFLLSAGADANAVNMDGVTPLHRAVRTRSLPAVRALVDGGADPLVRNKSGSTPLALARVTTGRKGSGSDHARVQQAGIIALLMERGADGGKARQI